MAADWEITDGKCTRVFLDPVPSFVVPAVETTGFDPSSVEAKALSLDDLSRIDTHPDEVLSTLDAFVGCILGLGVRAGGARSRASAANAQLRKLSPTAHRQLYSYGGGVDLLRDR